MKFLGEQDVKKLRSYAKKLRRRGLMKRRFRLVRNWFVIELGLEVGLRVMEIADLQCRDLLLDQASPEVIVRNGKCGKRRVIKVSRKFAARAEWFLRKKEAQGEQIAAESPVLVALRTRRPLCRRQIQKVFSQMVAKAGLSKRVGIHALRHTYGTRLYKASGGNLRLVQKQLGHSRITTTEVYADVMAEDAELAVEQLY